VRRLVRIGQQLVAWSGYMRRCDRRRTIEFCSSPDEERYSGHDPNLVSSTISRNLYRHSVLKTQLGAGSLVRTTVNNGIVYAILFSNVQLGALGLSFPPGLLADFIVFAKTGPGTPTNVAWFLSATSSQPSLRKRKPKQKLKPRPKPRAKLKQKRHPKRKQHR
jgi:hypothetical protein